MCKVEDPDNVLARNKQNKNEPNFGILEAFLKSYLKWGRMVNKKNKHEIKNQLGQIRSRPKHREFPL